jgi:lysophospholipase L1-like esterase
MKLLKNILFISLPFFFCLLIILELILNFFYPVPDPYASLKMYSDKPAYIVSQFEPNLKLVFTSNEGLPGMDNKMNFSTNNRGFRGDSLIIPKPNDEFRIFLVGGSTTENLYIDDTKSIEKLLQDRINSSNVGKKVKVFNAGKSGDFSVDHISMISHRILHLQPDMIVVFSGINDYRRMLNGFDYSQNQTSKSTNSGFFRDLRFFLSNFQLVRRMLYIVKPISPENLFYETQYSKVIKRLQTFPKGDTLPIFITTAYRTNLNSIIGQTTTNNVQLILMTQATTWNSKISTETKKYQWNTFAGNFRYEDSIMEKGLNKLNETMREVAAQKNIHIIDLASRVPKSNEYFYDDCHFNIKGVDFTSSIMADFILKNQLIK